MQRGTAQGTLVRLIRQRSRRPLETVPPDPSPTWFSDHYYETPDRICSFLASDGLSFDGLTVADIGSGDGIIDLGLARSASPAKLVGYDVKPVDVKSLCQAAEEAGVSSVLPDNLEFARCGEERLPAHDGKFDAVISWSAFEHIANPAAVLREMRRVLRPTGFMFLQVWPFYYSAFGGHLDDWLGEFEHLVLTDDEIAERVLKSDSDPRWAAYKLEEFRQLNRITVNELMGAIQDAGFDIGSAELYSHRATVTKALVASTISDLMIDGILVTAYPRSAAAAS
jgi:ubiquinone/menaquinone biosynthesis C-methylase UbiE